MLIVIQVETAMIPYYKLVHIGAAKKHKILCKVIKVIFKRRGDQKFYVVIIFRSRYNIIIYLSITAIRIIRIKY